jgi:hypothetical protein
MVTGATSPSPGFQPGATAAKKPEKSGWEKFGEQFNKGMEGVSMGGGGMPAQQPTTTPGAALAPTASGSINPEESEMRRQKLALAMQKLNSGKLW